MPNLCTAHRTDGFPCKATVLRGSDFCMAHQPAEGPAVGKDMARAPKSTVGPAPVPAVDPVLIGGAMQQMLLKQEVEDQLKRSMGRQKPRDRDGYELEEPAAAMPFRVIPRRRARDGSQALDSEGRVPKMLRPDWVQRWVRQRDHMDRPTQARVAEFEDFGYEVVYDDDNRKVEGRFGVLMQGAPEQYALRAAENTPKGANKRDDALMLAMDMAEAANRVAGDEVAKVFVDGEHRTERTLEGTGVERLREG